MDKGGNHMVKDSQVDKEERTNVAKRPPEQQKKKGRSNARGGRN